MTARKRLAARRSLETIAFEHEGQRFKLGIGREYLGVSDGAELLGPVVEIWLNGQKVNSPVDAIACDGAILISILLQYGCPPAEIAKAMKRSVSGAAASLFGHVADLITKTA